MAPEDYEGQPYPHPYLEAWLECRRYQGPLGGVMLPEPQKGPLDQDADLMLGFEVLEELAEERQRIEEVRQRLHKEAQFLN